MKLLLDGYRVVESARLLNGDILGMLLGDLGADVIKVEEPTQGDYLREMLGQIRPHYSPAHLQTNRNKRSLAIDLKSSEGRDVFWRLLKTADIFIDGNSAEVLDRLGIGYDAQRKVKPDIIYCQFTGYGAIGPYGSIPTHGEMMQSLAAGRPVARQENGFVEPDEGPPGLFAPGHGGSGPTAGGVFSAFFVAAALAHRALTGEGAKIDVSAADAVIAQALVTAIYSLNDHRITDRSRLPMRDRGRLTGARYQYYYTSDSKYILLCCIEERFWRRFCDCVGRSDLTGQYEEGVVDFSGGDDLRRELQGIIGQRTAAEWIALAIREHIPIGPAYNAMTEAAEDPHLVSRNIFHTWTHPVAGEFEYVGSPAVVDGEGFDIRRGAPALGQDTAELLAELGYSNQDVAAMMSNGRASTGIESVKN